MIDYSIKDFLTLFGTGGGTAGGEADPPAQAAPHQDRHREGGPQEPDEGQGRADKKYLGDPRILLIALESFQVVVNFLFYSTRLSTPCQRGSFECH